MTERMQLVLDKLHMFFVQASARTWLKRFGYLTAVFAGIALTAFLFLYQWYSTNLRARDMSPGIERVVTITPGTSATQIGEQLFQQKIIRNGTVFAWYVERHGIRQELQAGTYRFSSASAVPEIAERIAEGDVDTSVVQILPGLHTGEITALISHDPFSEEDIERALNRSYNHPVLADKPASAGLEGYIFPDTYQIDSTTTVESLFTRTFDNLQDKITPKMKRQFKKHGLNLHQAFTLASIVQEESADTQEQKKIAQVFLTRLERGMPLGADPTFKYAAYKEGVEASIDVQSPYNTRLNRGLPPGPISNFNLSALEAVAFPADTDFLYFVAGDDEKTYFSKTLQEHERLAEEHCTTLCE